MNSLPGYIKVQVRVTGSVLYTGEVTIGVTVGPNGKTKVETAGSTVRGCDIEKYMKRGKNVDPGFSVRIFLFVDLKIKINIHELS